MAGFALPTEVLYGVQHTSLLAQPAQHSTAQHSVASKQYGGNFALPTEVLYGVQHTSLLAKPAQHSTA
jgi:hypothetical protein